MISLALKETVLNLPEEDRIELAESLLRSFDEKAPSVLEMWFPELDRRLADYKSGENPSFSLEEVMASLRQR